MSNEDFPSPSEEEIDAVLNKLDPSPPDNAPEPTAADLNEISSGTAKQLGDTENIGDRPIDDVIEQLKQDGWYLVASGSNHLKWNRTVEPGKDTKIVGQGTRFYFFHRKRPVE